MPLRLLPGDVRRRGDGRRAGDDPRRRRGDLRRRHPAAAHALGHRPGRVECCRCGFPARRRRALPRQRRPQVRAVEAAPNDPAYADQWALPKIGVGRGAYVGHADPAGSSVVAVLDTGVDGSHDDLAGQLVAGTSVLDGWRRPRRPERSRHRDGRHRRRQDGQRPRCRRCRLRRRQVMPVQVLGADGKGQDSDIIAGVVWAAEPRRRRHPHVVLEPGLLAGAAGSAGLRVGPGRRARRGDRQRRRPRRRPSRRVTAGWSASRATNSVGRAGVLVELRRRHASSPRPA